MSELNPPTRSIARTLTLVGGASILAMTVIVIGVFYAFASTQYRDDANRFAQAQATAAARSIDVFEGSMRVTAENAHGAFRKQFAPTMVLLNADEGTLTNFGSTVNGSTTEVDRFAQDFPGSHAAIYVVRGDEFVSVTTSRKRPDGERAVGDVLGKASVAYADLMGGKRYVGRMLAHAAVMTVMEPIRDDAGKVIGASQVTLDISAQQRRLADAIGSTKIFDSGGLYVLNPDVDGRDASLVFHGTSAARRLSEIPSVNAGAWLARLSDEKGGSLNDVPTLVEPERLGARFAQVSRSSATGWLVVAEVRESEAMAQLHYQVMVLTAFIGLTATVLGVGLVLFMRRVVGPLQDLSLQVKSIGEGNLSRPLTSARRDEIGVITRAVEAMRQGLDRSLRQVQHATDSIRVASSEIADGNLDLSSRTEETASQLQQTASSMQQLTGAVRTSADAAAQANQFAASASDVAARGSDVVLKVVETMEDISSSSKRIADIVGVIDGIAFQTNILALNAAVEAARAGEQGRGFAVVAGEVRGLAQRSALAAREIKELIESSVGKIETGTVLVTQAGRTMTDVMASVRRMTDIIGEISVASIEQSQGIGQVNEAVSQVEEMTQRNAALVEQSSAAAASLKEQAHRLAEVAGAFVLSDEPISSAASDEEKPSLVRGSEPATRELG